MSFGDPLLNHVNEFFGLQYNLFSLGFGSDKGVVVVNHIALAPTSVEVITVWVRSFAHRELNNIKRNPVVPSAYDAVASTSNRHFCGLQGGIVGSSETPVC